jgi:long-chain acyl-CoA synthetase
MNLAEAIILKNVEKHPIKAAIGFKKKEAGWKELSWKKFSEIIFKTANALKGAGVQENDKVAIYSDNSSEWMIFDLAAMAIGALQFLFILPIMLNRQNISSKIPELKSF